MTCIVEISHALARGRQMLGALYSLILRLGSVPNLGDQLLKGVDGLLQTLSLGPKEPPDLICLDSDRVPKLLGCLEDQLSETLAILKPRSRLGRVVLL